MLTGRTEGFEADLKDNLYKVWNRMRSGTWFAAAGQGGRDPQAARRRDPNAGCADGHRHTAASSNELLISWWSRIRSIRCGVSGWRFCMCVVRRPVGCMCVTVATSEREVR